VKTLIVLAIVAAAGYYAYKAVWTDEPPSCGAAATACMQKCRRDTTEAPAAQACQEACQRDQALCQREKARGG
jgi:hypothetical protein